MKKLLNTLYVLTENSYLTLENENIVVNQETNKVAKIPLLTLESVICFNYPGASPQLIAACIKNGIGISFFSPSGKFYYRAQGEYINSSVLTRQAQYRIAENEDQKISYVKNMIIGKLYNSKEFIQKFAYNHNHQINENSFKIRINELNTYIDKINTSTTIDQIRGLEGKASQIYFDIFPNMILRDKDTFNFISRNRRPPVDPVNCLLSLAYTVLMHDCANACESVGLDPYLGFMHTSRPGRKSLALDLIEEFRAIIADRFVLYLINNQIRTKIIITK